MANIVRQSLTAATCLTAVLMLTACGSIAERLNRVGKEPELSAIENPYSQPGYRPVALPMPPQVALNSQPNSLWQPSRQTFFKDQRANKIGDILTIMISIADTADMKNTTARSRAGTEDAGLPNFLGIAESQLGKVLPESVNPAKLVGGSSKSTSTGDGSVLRHETINLKLAAMVTQVLPNGNFVIQGRQQVRVNAELRDLQLQGVIRPEDIQNNNSISYEKIAEARITYGGKGAVSDLQQPRYGQQIFDAIFPF
ncbi:MAG: flagellar basal body L-ring protein FlgH [Proteobacteria bacterium]|nr:flagellar basal body L-ring protein FlgH [Pseudomonadota bacterium]